MIRKEKGERNKGRDGMEGRRLKPSVTMAQNFHTEAYNKRINTSITFQN
jgi:hypothetical protein